MSYVKTPNLDRIDALHDKSGRLFLKEARAAEERERMLEAIEECRFEAGLEYNRTMHTVLDVLQYIVERT